MNQPTWVLDSIIPAIHDRQLEEHGGPEGLRDKAPLESALARPKHLWAYEPETSLERLAAAYAYGLARNHAFTDGNRRMALAVCETFLRLNGKTPTANQAEKVVAFTKLAAGEWDEARLAEWLTEHVE